MQEATLLFAALFLPLFPLSMVFNQLHGRLRKAWLRALLLLVWPQCGLYLITVSGVPVADWIGIWALFTAAFYAYRAIALRELGLWAGFLATSCWALLWLSPSEGMALHLQALGFSLPLALLGLISGHIDRRFGAAHVHARLALATTAPRLATALVFAVLAVIATPLFPGFFTMLASVSAHAANVPAIAAGLIAIWFLWTWSGIRLLEGLLVGDDRKPRSRDLSMSSAWIYGLGLAGLAAAGVVTAGAQL